MFNELDDFNIIDHNLILDNFNNKYSNNTIKINEIEYTVYEDINFYNNKRYEKDNTNYYLINNNLTEYKIINNKYYKNIDSLEYELVEYIDNIYVINKLYTCGVKFNIWKNNQKIYIECNNCSFNIDDKIYFNNEYEIIENEVSGNKIIDMYMNNLKNGFLLKNKNIDEYYLLILLDNNIVSNLVSDTYFVNEKYKDNINQENLNYHIIKFHFTYLQFKQKEK